MSLPTGNPSWIERGWSLWIQWILRLPRTVLLCVGLLTAAGGAYVLSGHPSCAPLFDFIGLPTRDLGKRPEPAFEREIVLRAELREGYDPAELADATSEAVRLLAAEGELFSDVEIRFATPAPSVAATAADAAFAGPVPTAGQGISNDAIRRAEDRIAFWQALPLQADGTVSPAELWRTLAQQGEVSPMHALEADGLLYAAAQRVSRTDDAGEADALARLTETLDTFWSLSAAIAPEASEARVFARLTVAASKEAGQRRLAHAKLSEGLDAVRLRWPSVAWTPSGPGYGRILEATRPAGPSWWDLVTLLGAAALAASAAGDLRRFAVAAVAALASGGAAYVLASTTDFEGLVSPTSLSLALAVWTALVATLLLSGLASALETESSPQRALAASLASAGTAALVPLLTVTVVYAIAAAGEMPGASALFRVVAGWSCFSLALWIAFFPAGLWSARRFGAWGRPAHAPSRAVRRVSPGVASPVAALTFAATLFLAWGAIHLRPGTEITGAADAPENARAGIADRRFALYMASSIDELRLARSRFAALAAVDATAAGIDGRVEGSSVDDARLRRIQAAALSLPAKTSLAPRPDWAAFTAELRNETIKEDSPASTSQRRRMANAALERTARMRLADVDQALGRCFEAWLVRRDREVAALAAFGGQASSGGGDARGGVAGVREADRFAASDGSPLLWIFPKPGVEATEFVGALRSVGADVGGPAVAAANRSMQRRRFGLQTMVFVVGVVAAGLMIVLASLRDVTAVLWAGGCSLAQTLGIAGWLGIPWHEEWIATVPLAAGAWMATALMHRLSAARGGGDLWTGAPFATLAASVAAMAVALRWIGVGDDASAAAASFWAISLAAGWWNGWAYCSRGATADLKERDESQEEALARERELFLQEAPTHAIVRPTRLRAAAVAATLPAEDRDYRLAESRSFADWDEVTAPLAFALHDDELTPALQSLFDESSDPLVLASESESRAAVPSRSFDRRDPEAGDERRMPTPRRERLTPVTPRRRALSREEPLPDAASSDSAWS
ncbi:MAG TPA: hypothetical protein VGN57_07160 [Pirellulaceae bacterium]|jgi:hypothetical protein|nr:hypothetical protein [Pirellulaceae bacterium]